MDLNPVESMARLLGITVADFLALRVLTEDGVLTMAELVHCTNASGEALRRLADPT